MLLFQSRVKVFFSCRRTIRWRTDKCCHFYLQLHPATSVFSGQSISGPAAELPSMCEDDLARTGEDIPWLKVAFRSMLSTVKGYTCHCQLLPHSLTEAIIESLRLLFLCEFVCIFLCMQWVERNCFAKAKPLAYCFFMIYHYIYGNGAFENINVLI